MSRRCPWSMTAQAACPLVDVVGADEKTGDFFDGTLRSRQADAQRRLRGHNREPFKRQREVCAAASADQRMNLVHDDGAYVPEPLAAAGRGEQQVERLGRGDQHVRRRAEHRSSGCTCGVSPVRTAAVIRGSRQPHLGRSSRDACQRLGQVLVNVAAEGLERATHRGRGPRSGNGCSRPSRKKVIDGDQERRQRLARTGWRCD